MLIAERDAAFAVLAVDVLRQAFHERLIERLGIAQSLGDSLAFDELADLATECREKGEQVLGRLFAWRIVKLRDTDHAAARLEREGKRAGQSSLAGQRRAEVASRRETGLPDRAPFFPYLPGQAMAGGKGGTPRCGNERLPGQPRLRPGVHAAHQPRCLVDRPERAHRPAESTTKHLEQL